MLIGLSRRLLSLLQLTRMALVFTAIADAQAALLLADGAARAPGEALLPHLSGWRMLAVGMISIGLYGFGMSLNDIIDRRRDRQIAAHRPLPSGRVGIVTAHLICIALAIVALAGGALFRAHGGGLLSIALLGVTFILITFYDFAGKYVVGPGLITLGLVRACQAAIPVAHTTSPYVPVVFHPLWLLNHVTILSAVAYVWEEKRPPLNRRHWIGVFTTLLVIDVLSIFAVGRSSGRPFLYHFNLRWGLLLPVAASAAFMLLASRLRRTSATSREAGQKLMLFGLLWLIVYDATFVAAYVDWAAAGIILLLLPVAYCAVQVMRWWSKIASLSQRPTFKRAGT